MEGNGGRAEVKGLELDKVRIANDGMRGAAGLRRRRRARKELQSVEPPEGQS